jgi:uncharacterized protein YqkB
MTTPNNNSDGKNKDVGIRIHFTDKLKRILQVLDDRNNYIAFELLYMIEPSSKYHNGLKISKVNVSKEDYNFDVTIQGKVTPMRIVKFLQYFKLDSDYKEIHKFLTGYNRLKESGELDSQFGKPIDVPPFNFNPKDVRSTFLSLVTKTYPHGHEDDVLPFLPDLEKDKVGNYYKIIGNSKPTTMFTSHLDTADRTQKDVSLYSLTTDGTEYIFTDGESILGADDKSGVTVMLYMMAHNVPGLYYFFIGEERGGIGSHALADIFYEVNYLQNINKCVSFDRRNNHSVITHQLGGRCCSDEFGNSLCNEYNKNGLSLKLDDGGIYTDSASFTDDIPECTNISVGYLSEHTGHEEQDMTYLIKLCKASVNVNWDSLVIKRRVGVDPEIVRKNKPFLDAAKGSIFNSETKVIGDSDGKAYYCISINDGDIDDIYEDLKNLNTLINNRKMNNIVTFSDEYLKIELKS